MAKSYRFTGKVFKYPGMAAWHFVTLPKKESADIKAHAPKRAGWGAVKISVTVGKTTWDTSIFPTKEGVYLLPLKASVRKHEDIYDGDTIDVQCILI